jgi:hypothetical protein
MTEIKYCVGRNRVLALVSLSAGMGVIIEVFY